jgi:translation initiation factor IF-1
MSKRAAAENKNRTTIQAVIDGRGDILGRVEKSFGNGGFKIILGDGKEVQGLIRGVFKGGAKSSAFVAAGMFVSLAPSTSRKEAGRMVVHEITGVVNKKKDLKALKDAKVLPDLFLESGAGDDLFDYDGYVEVEEKDDTGKVCENLVTKYNQVKDALNAIIPSGGAAAPAKLRTKPAAVAAAVRTKPAAVVAPSVWDVSEEAAFTVESETLAAARAALPSADEFDIDAI